VRESLNRNPHAGGLSVFRGPAAPDAGFKGKSLSLSRRFALTHPQAIEVFTRFPVGGRTCSSNYAAERKLRGIALGRDFWPPIVAASAPDPGATPSQSIAPPGFAERSSTNGYRHGTEHGPNFALCDIASHRATCGTVNDSRSNPRTMCRRVK